MNSTARASFGLLVSRLFKAALIIGTVTLPFHKTTSNIALAAAAVLGLIISIREKKINYTFGVLPVCMFAVYSLSILYSDDKKEGLRAMELGVAWLYIPLIFGLGGQYLSVHWRDRLLQYFSLSVIVLCVICYGRIVINTGRYLPDHKEEAYTYYDPFSRYSFTEWIDFHPTYLSMYLICALIIIFMKAKAPLVAKLALMMLIAFFLIILSSKNQLLIFFPVSGVLLWRAVSIHAAWKLVLVVLLLGIVTFAGLQSDQIKYRLSTEMASNSGERATFWAAGSTLFKEDPWVGKGVGDGQHAIDAWMIENNRQDLIDYNLHNQFLDFAIHFGLVGLGVFAAILILPIIRRVDISFMLFILVVSTSCMTEALLVRQKGLCFFVLVYGLLGSGYPLLSGSMQQKDV